jgi:hypothetical protein
MSVVSQGFDLAQNATFNPGTISQPTWFRRTVKSSSSSSSGFQDAVPSNAVKFEFNSATSSPTVGAATYSENKDIKGIGTITIQGNQTPASGVTVNFIADTHIVILQSSVISPNVRLSIGALCSVSSGGRLASPEEMRIIEQKVSSEEVIEAIDGDIGIYPNPSSGYVHMKLPDALTGAGKVVVLDKFSNEVYKSELPPGAKNVSLDLSFLPQDTYYLKVSSDEGKVLTARFIVNTQYR